MKILKVQILLIIALLISASGFAQTSAMELDSKLPIDSKVTIGTLKNGIKYYVRSNNEPENRAELTLVIKAGSILEDEDQQGLAHMCEHMAFNGTTNFKKHEIIEFLESIGMKFGPEVNAYTSFDETVYGIKIPLDSVVYLDKGLLVLHDWASEVSFEAEEIDKERGVIHEEWRMGQGAQDRMMRQYLPLMLNNSRYSNRLPIGTMDVVDNCDYDVLRRFYKDWYRPDLMAVIAVGDFDEKEVEKKISDLFSKITPVENPRKREYYKIPDHEETYAKVVTDKEAQQTLIQLIYKHPTSVTKTVADYRENITHRIYNGMMNSRLQELTLQENPPFLYGFAGYSGFIGPVDAFSCIALINTEQVKSGLAALVKENARVKKYGFTETEFEREKKAILRNMEKAYNERNKIKSSSYVSEYKRNFLQSKEPIPGMEYEYELYKKYVPGIKLSEINSLAEKWIIEKNRILLLLGTEKEGVTYPSDGELLDMLTSVNTNDIEPYNDKTSDKPFISEMPKPVKVKKKKKNKELDVKIWHMKNGATVYYKKTDFKEDEILFTAYSLGGYSLYDQEDDISAKQATSIISESGIGNFDKIELEKYLSDKIAHVSPYIGELTEGLNGSTTPQDLETMMQLIYLHFTKPRKDKTAYNSYVSRMKGMLENKSASPDNAFRDSIQVIMASHHPRSRPLTAELLDETNYAKAHYIYKQRFSDPGNFAFFFVGNIDKKKFKPLVEKYIGGLPTVNRNEKWKDLGINAPDGVVVEEVRKGNDPKSVVFLKFHGDFDYNWKNKAQLTVMSEIITTKLLETIREEESGVYSIGAYPGTSHYPNSEYGVTIYFGCDPDKVDYLVKETFKQLDLLAKNGPTDEEISKAKKKLLRKRETNLRENRFWLNTMKNTIYHKSNPKEFYQYNDYIEGITAKDVMKSFSLYINKKSYVEVVLKPELEKEKETIPANSVKINQTKSQQNK